MGAKVHGGRNGIASNYDCAICNCPASMQSAGIETPASANLLPGNTRQYTATAKYFDCNSAYSYYNVTTSATWSSNNTPVATVNNSGAKGLATAQAMGGSATIHFSYNGYGYAPTCPPPRPKLDAPR